MGSDSSDRSWRRAGQGGHTKLPWGASPQGSCFPAGPALHHPVGEGRPRPRRASPHPLRGWGKTGTARCWGQRRVCRGERTATRKANPTKATQGTWGPAHTCQHPHKDTAWRRASPAMGANPNGQQAAAAPTDPPDRGLPHTGTGLGFLFFLKEEKPLVVPGEEKQQETEASLSSEL